MTDFTHEWIAKREELEQAATEGPWRRVTEPGTNNHALHDPRDADIATDYEGVWYDKGDAEFIADARTSLPAALAALKVVLGMGPLPNHRDMQPGDRDYADGYNDALRLAANAITAALRRKS